MAILLGNSAKPTSTQEWTGPNNLNVQGHTITLPGGGPWQIVQVGAWLAGKTSSVGVYLCVWDASGNLIGYSGYFTATGRPFALGNCDNYLQTLVAQPIVAGGTTVYVGWGRDPAGSAQWGRYATPGAHLDKTNTPSWPGSLAGASVDNGGDISAYIYYQAANAAPTAPTLNSPANGALVTVTTPVLNFTPHDPDGDAHTGYTYQIDDNSDFSSVVESIEVLGSFTDNVAINRTVSGALTPGVTYYWRVKTKDAASGYGPYSASRSFVVNANPNTPSALTPTGNSITADQTPDLTFFYSDPEGQPSALKRVQVATDSGFTAVVYDSGQVAAVVASGNNIVTTCTTTLTRGTTYYWRAAVWDQYGFPSAWSGAQQFRINSLPVATLLTPNDATGKLAKMDFVAGAGWAAPRMVVSWSYSDAQSQAQTQYELEVITDNAGAPTGTTKVSGVVASSASTVTPAPATDYVENTRYHVRVRVFDGLEWSAWSGFFICCARWGLSVHAKDVSISGAAPTAWSTTGLNVSTGATSALVVEYNSSTAGGAPPDAWKNSLALVTKRKWVHYRVWFFAWGTSPATRPALNDITIQASGFVAQPDFWLPSPIASQGGSVELGKFAFGTQSLRMTGDGTEQIIRQQVRVEPNTLYMFQARVESVGNSGAQWRLSDTAAGASVFDLNTALTSDAAMAQYVAGPWDSGSRTAVWIQCRINGAAGTAAFFDAVQLEKGTLASGYKPSPLGSSPSQTGAPAVVDAGGVQIDAQAGGILRLRGSAGGVLDVVELGARGLDLGGNAHLFRASAPVVQEAVDSGPLYHYIESGGTADDSGVVLRRASEANDRAALVTGGLSFGPGSSARDVGIVRSGASILELNGGGVAPLALRYGGTAFPTGVNTGDHFFRTDYRMWFFWDGTRWLSETLFAVPYVMLAPITVNTYVRASTPNLIGTNFYYEWLTLSLSVATTHSAANYWDLVLYDEGTGVIFTCSTSWVIVPSIGTLGGKVHTVSVLSGNIAADSWSAVRCTTTGAPGALQIYATAYGRVVAT